MLLFQLLRSCRIRVMPRQLLVLPVLLLLEILPILVLLCDHLVLLLLVLPQGSPQSGHTWSPKSGNEISPAGVGS
jgi:hypothetical protein